MLYRIWECSVFLFFLSIIIFSYIFVMRGILCSSPKVHFFLKFQLHSYSIGSAFLHHFVLCTHVPVALGRWPASECPLSNGLWSSRYCWENTFIENNFRNMQWYLFDPRDLGRTVAWILCTWLDPCEFDPVSDHQRLYMAAINIVYVHWIFVIFIIKGKKHYIFYIK